MIFTRFWEHRTHFSSVPSPKAINTTFFSQAEKNLPTFLMPHCQHKPFFRALLRPNAIWPLLLTITPAWLQMETNPSCCRIWIYVCDIPFRQGAFSQFPLLHRTEVNCEESHVVKLFWVISPGKQALKSWKCCMGEQLCPEEHSATSAPGPTAPSCAAAWAPPQITKNAFHLQELSYWLAGVWVFSWKSLKIATQLFYQYYWQLHCQVKNIKALNFFKNFFKLLPYKSELSLWITYVCCCYQARLNLVLT